MLTPEQEDLLKELLNICFGWAARSLSSMLGRRIEMRPPEIVTLPLHRLHTILSELNGNALVAVHQPFRGDLPGDALLLVSEEGATRLVDLLGGMRLGERPLLPSDREALVEMGNILLSAYVGMLANQTGIRASFSAPHLHQLEAHALQNLLQYEIMVLTDQVAVIIKTAFQVTEKHIEGYLVMIISHQALRELLANRLPSDE